MLTTDERRAEVEAYVAAARRETEIERLSADREKTGVFIGSYAINPMNQERIPIWVADYVLPGYGTGAIMAVPAHDERDGAFARKYDLPMRYVVRPASGELPDDEAFVAHTADEVLVDSGEFSGMPANEAIGAITQQLADLGIGGPAVSYKIRDWLVSRQRYWGAPIPIVYCPEHGAQPVPEDQLPVLLPEDVDFAPTGVSPLQSHADVPEGQLSGLRCRGAPRDGHDGHLRRLGLVFPALLLAERRRAGLGPGGRGPLDAGRPVHRWRGARRAAPDVRALLRQGAARHGPRCPSTSPSWRCATRGRSWAPITSA